MDTFGLIPHHCVRLDETRGISKVKELLFPHNSTLGKKRGTKRNSGGVESYVKGACSWWVVGEDNVAHRKDKEANGKDNVT